MTSKNAHKTRYFLPDLYAFESARYSPSVPPSLVMGTPLRLSPPSPSSWYEGLNSFLTRGY